MSGLGRRVARLEAAASEALLRRCAAKHGLDVDELRAEVYQVVAWQLAGASDREVIERLAAEENVEPEELHRELEIFKSGGAPWPA